MKIVLAILFLIIGGGLLSLLDGAIGYWLLNNVWHLGYWTWWKIAYFGTVIVSSGVSSARLRD